MYEIELLTVVVTRIRRPAVPLAKWTAVKRADPSTLDRVKAWFTPESAQDLLDSVEDSSRKTDESHERSDEVDEKEIAALISGAVSEAITPLTERMDAFEVSAKEATKSDEDDEEKIELTKAELEEAVETASKAAAKDAVAEVLVKFEEHIDAIPKVSSKSLAESLRGQDGDNAAKKGREGVTRDAFGRNVRKES